MCISASLSAYKGERGEIYGVYPYGSFFALRTGGHAPELRAYIDAVIYFKKSRRHTERFRRVIDALKAEWGCDVVAAVPPSTAGMMNTLQEMYGELLRRTKDSPQRKYNHKAELDETGKIEIKLDCKGKNILLVDDVATTGKTLYYFAQMLKESGAASVKMLAVGLSYKLAAPDLEKTRRMERYMQELPEGGEDGGRVVSVSEIASWLGMAPSAVYGLKQKGGVVERNGGYELKKSVLAYISYLKKRQDEKAAAQDDELKFWKIEKAKEAVRSWRMGRDRQVCVAVLDRLRSAVAELRTAAQGHADVVKALGRLAGAIEDIAPEDIFYTVEGEDNDEA